MHVTITLPAPHLDALIAAAESNRRQPRLLNEALVAVRAALVARRAEAERATRFQAFWELNQHLNYGEARDAYDIHVSDIRAEADARVLAAWRREDEALARAEEEESR